MAIIPVRAVQLFEETGTVCSIQGYHENTYKKLSAYDELTMIEAIVNQPSLYLHELQHKILITTGNDLSIPTICKYLHKQHFSRKKLTFRAQQRSEELRAKYNDFNKRKENFVTNNNVSFRYRRIIPNRWLSDSRLIITSDSLG